METAARRTRMSRDGWLRYALEALRREGIQGVRIEKLAREMGVTKGSFYWHFADLADLQHSLLEFWSSEYTEVVTRHSHLEERDPVEAVLQLMHMVREQNLDRYELSMRAWAEHDPLAARMVERIYQDRVQFVQQLLRRVGFTRVALQARIRLLLCYLSWEPSMIIEESSSARERILLEVHQILTTRSD